MTATERNAWLAADDDALLRACDLIMQKGTGNGGQKINKTSSAVRLKHRPTGIAVSANEERSQSRNRHIALRKLRYEIAMNIHAEPDAGFALLPSPSPSNHARLIPWIAELFDRLNETDYDLSETAEQCGVSVSQLERAMRKHPVVWKRYCELKPAKEESGPDLRS